MANDYQRRNCFVIVPYDKETWMMKFYNCDIYKFKELISNKKLVCFGAGRGLRNFLQYYGSEHIEQCIHCIADNMYEYMEKEIQINDVKIPIIDIDTLLNMKDIILLITCRDICGVYEQLSSYPELEDIWCFTTIYIIGETNRKEEENRYYPENYRITKEPEIPKRIHYCWFGIHDIPKKNRIWMESWEKYCPDYEIVRWDENNYDVTKNEYMYEAYKAGRWGFVSDYARLDIIYNYGGIYLDTDVELLKNLDELLYQRVFAGVDGSRNISLGLGFGAKKGVSIIKELKDLYKNKKFKKKDGSYDLTAVPTIQRPYFIEKGYINNGEYQIIDGMTVYSEKVLSAKCSWTGKIAPNEHSFTIHHYDGSWTDQSIREQNRKNSELFKKIITL